MSHWEVRLSNSRGIPYFYNTETQEAKWDPPPQLSEQEIEQLPGAQHYLKSKDKHVAPEGQIRASHLLIKHAGSRRPSSWKEAHITRTEDEAIVILQGYAAQIGDNPNTFAALAREHSDCSSHDRGGDLGFFGQNMMQKPFEEAAYALQVGEISDIVKTDSGVHLILRTA